MKNRATAKIGNSVCFPEPLGCFALPADGRGAMQELVPEEATTIEDYGDEYFLSSPEFAESLRAQDPPGCFLCVADTLGDDV